MKDERGFTLVELLVAMALSALLMTVLANAVFRMGQGFDASTSQMAADRTLDNASVYLGGDVSMGKYTDLTSGAAAAASMQLFWNDYYTGRRTFHSIRYYLSGGNLLRDYDGSIATVADSVTAASFSLSGSVVTVALTATATTGTSSFAESKTYRLRMRPEL